MNRKQIIDAIQWVLIAILAGWVCYVYYQLGQKRSEAQEQVKIEQTNTTYRKIYEGQEIASLKATNEELYDSIAKLQDVKSAVIIKYRYKYATDTVYVEREAAQDSLYHYESDNDTIKYTLDIAARELMWHRASFSIKDQFTLVNTERNGVVSTTLTHSPNMVVDDMPVFYKKQSFRERLKFGPSVGIGYGLWNRNVDVYVGVSASYTF